MPPPEPKSSTTSPGFKLANAVGLPQPRDASRASSGIWLASESVYNFEVMGSQQCWSVAAVAPQQELPPFVTRSAACPYFSLTTSLISVLIVVSYLQTVIMASALPAWLRVQHSA